MKKNLIYVSVALLTIFSCSDEFSTTPAVGALSEESLANVQGADLLLTGAYSVLDGVRNNLGGAPGWSASGDNWYYDVMSDDSHKGSTNSDQDELLQIERYDITSGNSYFNGKFRALYAGVNRCNAALSLIRSIEDEDLTGMAAEAHFLRAHFYFELQKIYGNVAIISVENFENQEFNQPNSGPAWAQIESDLQFAMDNLPEEQDDPGRATSWTAKAFMGKAMVYQGQWAPALAMLNDVINNGPYDLNAEFLDNFTAAGENSPESVFAIQFASDGGQSLNGNQGGTLNFPGGGPFGSCCGFYQPTIDLANAYKVDGAGLPLLDTFNNSDIANDYGVESSAAFTPERGLLDPRIDYTIGRRGIDYNGFGEHIGKDWIRASFADLSGPHLPKKNVYQAAETGANQGTGAWGQQHSGVNYNIMRFADVLLLAAEAAVETNDLALALTLTNRVRNRAVGTTRVKSVDGSGDDAANYSIAPYAGFANQGFARKAVRFERRLELAMEGHRMFDLRRWGNAEQVLNTYVANESRAIPSFGEVAGTYQAKFDLSPIPLDAIDLSGGALTQNPGY